MTRRGVGIIGLALLGLVAGYMFANVGYALLHQAQYASDLPRVVRYVIGPGLIGLALLLAALVLSPGNRLLAGTYALAFMIALFAAETVLTIRSMQGAKGLAGFVEGELSGAAQFKSSLPPSYTLKAMNAKLGVTMPDEAMLGGIPGAEVLLCTRDNVPVAYRADRYGFRNPDSVYDRPVEILLLGDSFTEGICLEDGSDLAGQLRALNPATLNTGTRGAGPLFELAILRRWGPLLGPPETLMLFFEGNDWENLRKELLQPYLRGFLDPEVDAGPPDMDRARLNAAERVVRGWWQEQKQSVGGFLERRAWIRNFLALQQVGLLLGLHYPKAAVEQAEYADILARARATAESWGGRVRLVYVPQVDRFVGLLPSAAAYDGLRNRVKAAATEAGVELIDLTGPISALDNPRSAYAADSHFNETGARIAAKTIVAALVAN